ncbi:MULTISPECIES: hypothetical protein [unclassified Alteromonas]|uniref:hypothetical protein n=1 Tax=unclassified Alteromonas TaxID=2614992 RepID=UPI000948E21F|nr:MULTISPECIES: hypothetical protein [unclassified Alteromonas]MCG7639601.1 hypothetical protein [Alteromonas sp. CNT1-28]OLF78312.1 hypothetical protein AWH61_00005 [Alteromonas sp. W12]
MSERSVELAKQHIAESYKYDYFVVGISAATFAYFAKDFKALSSFALNSNTLIALSLILLAISVLSGLRKIKLHTHHLAVNSQYLDASSHLAAYKKNYIEGGTGINLNTGELLTPVDSSIKAQELESLIPKIKENLNNQGDKVFMSSKVRDLSLYLAYAALSVSKILPIFEM